MEENDYYFIVIRGRNQQTGNCVDSGTVYEFPKHMSPKDVFDKVNADMLERSNKYLDMYYSIVAFKRV